MRRTIYKLFWAWDFDKEEKWLNEMSAKGLQLAAVGLCKYIFDEGQRGEYNVRLELLDNLPTHAESTQYIKFVEETGAEYLGSVFRWVYFRKKNMGDGFDLFSDLDSRIKHLKRILTLIGFFGILELYYTINNLHIYFTHGYAPSLFFGILFLLFTVLIGYGFYRIYRKMSQFKTERGLHE